MLLSSQVPAQREEFMHYRRSQTDIFPVSPMPLPGAATGFELTVEKICIRIRRRVFNQMDHTAPRALLIPEHSNGAIHSGGALRRKAKSLTSCTSAHSQREGRGAPRAGRCQSWRG